VCGCEGNLVVLVGSGSTTTVYVADLDGKKTVTKTKWTATVTVKVVDQNGVPVTGAAVAGTWSGAYTGSVACTTTTAGTCSVTTGGMKLTATSVPFTVNSVSGSGLIYNSAANTDPDSDSTGTVITLVK
jgi:hypothetical protein